MSDDKDRPGGFYKIDNSILRDYGPQMGPYGIAVYNVFAMYADCDGGGIHPSYDTIAKHIGASRRKVIEVINQLCELGIVSKELRAGETGKSTSNDYRLVNWGACCAPQEDDVLELGVHEVHYRGAQDAPSGVHEVHYRGAQDAPNKDPIDQYPIDPESERAREEPLKPPPGYKTITGVSSTYMPKGMSLPRGYVAAGTGTNAVQVYYERFRIDKPDERLNMPQQDDLARTCTDLARLREVIIAYSRAGYKPRNINLILDWYRDGVPDKRNNRSARNGTYSRNGRRAEQPAPEPKPTVVVDAAFKEQLRRARGYAPKPIPIT